MIKQTHYITNETNTKFFPIEFLFFLLHEYFLRPPPWNFLALVPVLPCNHLRYTRGIMSSKKSAAVPAPPAASRRPKAPPAGSVTPACAPVEQPLAVPLVQVQPLAAPPAPAAPAHAADPGAEVQDAAAGEEKHAVPATPRVKSRPNLIAGAGAMSDPAIQSPSSLARIQELGKRGVTSLRVKYLVTGAVQPTTQIHVRAIAIDVVCFACCTPCMQAVIAI